MRLSRDSKISAQRPVASESKPLVLDSRGEAIECEISPANPVDGAALAAIATTCSLDLRQALKITVNAASRSQKESVITLHLSAELAISQHPVWCLACRLACFCPTARISVLVHNEDAFADAAVADTRRRSA